MKEITQNNILLAEFLGWRKNTVVSDGKGRYYDFVCPDGIEVVEEHEDCYCSDCGRSNTTKSYLYGEDLKFHNDWNWLMLVVEKIENSGMLFKVSRWREDEVLLNGYWCTISDSFSGVEFADSAYIDDTETRIEAIYLACIQFVKWYNNENKR